MSLEVGQLLDNKYRIVRLIGEGGMGAVFEGENVRINRRVAIKVLHGAFAGNAEVMQRFEREAQAAGRIGNDHILEVLDLGLLPNGDRYIIMEFLDGEALSNRINSRGRLAPHELAPLIRQTLVGLGAAHAAGIVHRDLKPDNLFILREKAGQKDYIKIIDFGISKFQPLSGDGMKMTRTGAVMGTPYYMSPEQASGSGEADARSDVYSLGVIMYEAVTGRVPFDAGTFNQLMFKIVLADVPTPQSVVPDLDPAFASIISKAMARDLTHRFQSTIEVLNAIDAWRQSGRAVTVPPHGEAARAGYLPPTSRVSLTSASDIVATPGQGTAGAWASSQTDVAQPARRRSKAARPSALLFGCAVLILLGGAFAMYSRHVRSSTPSAAAVPTAPAKVAASSVARAAEPAAVTTLPAADSAQIPEAERATAIVSASPSARPTSVSTVGRSGTSSRVPPRSRGKTSVRHATADFGY